ncbi:C-C motif chemokine 4 homolog [Odontesthes bonariensis]|uniref:C-C motif chemokine 4 homolog n=1 Tax=Odontesthes bonariensis TaxID=219752 RepID=UPI003F585310
MVSIKVAMMAITLITVCVLASNTSAVYRGCCRSYIKGKLPFQVIKGYSVQDVTEMCPINAIIFHTKKGKVCTNPALQWVMDYVNRLRNKAQRVHQKSQSQQ